MWSNSFGKENGDLDDDDLDDDDDGRKGCGVNVNLASGVRIIDDDLDDDLDGGSGANAKVC